MSNPFYARPPEMPHLPNIQAGPPVPASGISLGQGHPPIKQISFHPPPETAVISQLAQAILGHQGFQGQGAGSPQGPEQMPAGYPGANPFGPQSYAGQGMPGAQGLPQGLIGAVAQGLQRPVAPNGGPDAGGAGDIPGLISAVNSALAQPHQAAAPAGYTGPRISHSNARGPSAAYSAAHSPLGRRLARQSARATRRSV